MKLDMSILRDLADNANSLGKYKVPFTLSPELISKDKFSVSRLTWQKIKFGDDLNEDKRGVYAFVVEGASPILPAHGYVMYMGIAGRDSNRSLKERYRDYFNARSLAKRRSHIAYLLAQWSEVLTVYYASVDSKVSNEELKSVEKQLNSALLPPFARSDMEAEIRSQMGAFPR